MKERARQFALERHAGQLYGNYPYSFHLDEVAKIASAYGEEAIVVAYLHDVVEDTSTDLDEIESEFNGFIARCVGILTDEPGASRKERKAKTHDKMAKIQGDLELALIVKASDRLANLRACVAEDNEKMLMKYKEEHVKFREAVYRANLCEPLWQEIEEIIG